MNHEFQPPAGMEADDSDFTGMVESVAEGDEKVAAREWGDAESSFKEALAAANSLYGTTDPRILPILVRLGDAQLQTAPSSDYFEDLTRTWQRVLAVTSFKHGPQSPELIPVIKKLIGVYDLQGAHIVGIELLQRLQALEELKD
jgi:hypothetical protein